MFNKWYGYIYKFFLIIYFILIFPTFCFAQDANNDDINKTDLMVNSTVPIEYYNYQKKQPIITGTGFFVSFLTQGNKEKIFLVTNSHIAKQANEPNLQTLIKIKKATPDMQLALGNSITVDLSNLRNNWFFNTDSQDIAILDLTNLIEDYAKKKIHFYFRPIPSSCIANDSDINKLELIEDIVFVGYPENKYDKKNLIPIIRKGITATPVKYDFNNEPAFYIDASIFPGSSGSPVFIIQPSTKYDGGSDYYAPYKFYLIGIESDTIFRDNDYELGLKTPNGNYFPIKQLQLIDLGKIIKSKEILKTIQQYINIKSSELK